jgi:PAS domain S-box-containing protein
LGRLQTQLETRVGQRTAELRNAIEQLRLEVEARLQAELAERESEARFRQIANAAPVVIWTSGADRRIGFLNDYAKLFTARGSSRKASFGWAASIHPDDVESNRRMYFKNIEAGLAFELEYRVRRSDGEYRWLLDRATPRFLPNGDFAGYVGIAVDLTEVKRAGEKAFAAKNLENLRVLSAGIAHDFNTLLGGILGEADLALGDLPEESAARENLTRIAGLANRSAGIVRLLLAYAGDPAFEVETDLVDIGAIVRELAPHLKSSIIPQAEIRTQIPQELPVVRAKPSQIRQVVLNLILNAAEALGKRRGLITVAASQVRLNGGLRDSAYADLPDGEYVRLEVSDTGQGMTEEVRARIFDPYFSTKLLGRGLGLAAVQGIVHSHGGLIAASSVPGAGSTFEVLLPCAAPNAASTG